MRARQIDDKFCLVLWPDRLEIWQSLASTIRIPTNNTPVEANHFLVKTTETREAFEKVADKFDVWSLVLDNWR